MRNDADHDVNYDDNINDHINDHIPINIISWKLWSEMVVEWIKGVIRQQKCQQDSINDLYKKIDDINDKIAKTREDVIKADHTIDSEVIKIKSDINRDTTTITDRSGKIYTVIASVIAAIIAILIKIFGG